MNPLIFVVLIFSFDFTIFIIPFVLFFNVYIFYFIAFINSLEGLFPYSIFFLYLLRTDILFSILLIVVLKIVLCMFQFGYEVKQISDPILNVTDIKSSFR